MKDIARLFVSPQHSIEDTVAVIQNGAAGIALVVDGQKRLLTTVTDGDVRRAILRKIKLTEPVSLLMNYRPSEYAEPVTLPAGTSHDVILRLMEEKLLKQIPLLDEQGAVVELALLSELFEEEHFLPLTAVIMAGGKGQRLLPLTMHTPKPMLPLDDKPIIEYIIKKLISAGIKDIYISLNYKAEVIKNYFGESQSLDARIHYIHEKTPLGTAGALGMIAQQHQPVLVINGDIVTQLDFRLMHDFHKSHDADMTVGVRIYEIEIPYGVIEAEDIHIKNLVEKPKQVNIVNAGIYLLAPSVLALIKKEERLDMTDLLHRIIDLQMKAICFPIQEYWLDVGRKADYKQARLDIKDGRV